MSQRTLEQDGALDPQELYYDLARKYRNVGSKVETIWRKFTPKQREKAMKETTGDGQVLEHSRDRSRGMGVFCDYIPEYNLRDIRSTPEHFLDNFKFRALTPLQNQLYEGVNGGPGDREILEATGFRHAAGFSPEEKTMFLEGEYYGKSFKPTAPGGKFGLPFPNAEFVIIPRSLGELILVRQGLLYQYLNHLVEEILDLGSETRHQKTGRREDTADKALVTAASQLAIQPKPLKISLPEVRAQAIETKAALEDYLLLLRAEPVILNDAVNTAYCNRTELVPDDRGRVLPALTDRHLSAAFFEAVTVAVKSIAIWDYILRLLELLEKVDDKVKRGLIIQELSNTCHLEFRRTQDALKHSVAPQTHVAGKAFKRMPDGSSGRSKLAMKRKPAEYTVSDPQLYYILQLCHPDTSPAAAQQWIQKIDDHNGRYDEDRKRLRESEVAALGDLAIIVRFMHFTSTAFTMATVSRKLGVLFTARSTDLDIELSNLKPTADFGDHLAPMHNLLEPGVAARALGALDKFITKETGARLGSLYEDIVQDALEDLEERYLEAKARQEKVDKKTTYVPLPGGPSPSSAERVAHRKAKEKTRPVQSTVYTISAPENPEVIITEPEQQFQVKATTAAVFTALFSRSEAHGSVSWTSFEAAMADLGFSVTPKGGSVFTFNAPASMESRPITLHRPHVSEIEGYKLLIIARRLQRVYGWSAKSFFVA
jgi:hypothetical protein